MKQIIRLLLLQTWCSPDLSEGDIWQHSWRRRAGGIAVRAGAQAAVLIGAHHCQAACVPERE
jgi:hypothetical protein